MISHKKMWLKGLKEWGGGGGILHEWGPSEGSGSQIPLPPVYMLKYALCTKINNEGKRKTPMENEHLE